jgi:hypothetical protein
VRDIAGFELCAARCKSHGNEEEEAGNLELHLIMNLSDSVQ